MNTCKYYFETIDSTNEWIKRNFDKMKPNTLTCVTAQSQTQGKGQQGRSWLSPQSGNLYTSFHFQKSKTLFPNPQNYLTIHYPLALCVIEILQNQKLFPCLKWPNDILINHKKIGGILTEVTTIDNQIHFILGLGLNINMEQKELQTISQPATSMKNETNQDYDVFNICDKILDSLRDNLNIYFEKGFEPFYPIIRNFMTIYDKKLLVPIHETLVEATCLDMNPDGSLKVSSKDRIWNTFEGSFIK